MGAEGTAALAKVSLAAPPAATTNTVPKVDVATLAKRGPGACHNCDDPNHESRDCPQPCRECGSDKHRIGFHYRTGIKTSKCFNCEAIGHESRDCPMPCGICGSSQHKSGYHLNDHLYVGKAEPAPTAGKSASAPGSTTARGGSGGARAPAGGGRAPASGRK